MRNYLKDHAVAILAFLFGIYVYLVPPAPLGSAPVPVPTPALIYASR